jgi:hypothetical protein
LGDLPVNPYRERREGEIKHGRRSGAKDELDHVNSPAFSVAVEAVLDTVERPVVAAVAAVVAE